MGMLALLLALSVFQVRIETTKGSFVVEVHPEWAPRAAERFRALVKARYYDDSRFFRVVAGKWAQFGIPGRPAPKPRPFPDEQRPRQSNLKGTIAFAFAEPGSRSAQVFVNLADDTRLDAQGFAPFGRVVSGMDVVEKLYAGYGEESGGGIRAGKQQPLYQRGNAWLDARFPKLDKLIRARILPR